MKPKTETDMRLATSAERLSNKQDFVAKLGEIYALTREGIQEMRLINDETVEVVMRTGAGTDTDTFKVNIACDSYAAIIYDVANAVEGRL